MEKKWFFGIDVSKLTLDVAVYCKEKKGRQKDVLQVTNDKSGFKELHKWLKQQTKHVEEMVVCLEHTGVYTLDLCVWMESKQIDYSLLCPLHLKRSMGLVRGKNDKVDAIRISDYCYLHREDLEYSKVPNEEIQKLKNLMNERDDVVKQRSRLKGQEPKQTQATTSTHKRYKRKLRELERDLNEIENEIDTIVQSCALIKETYELLTSIVGIGMVNAVSTIVATRNFTSFEDPRKYACHIGIAPFSNQSGTSVKGRTKVSFYGNRHLKGLITDAARAAVQHDKEIKAYYERKSAEGKEHGVIMNAVKCKLVNRMFSVVRRKEKYENTLNYKRVS